MPVISGVMGALGGVIDFITGVFSGNWNLAWQGICGIMQGVWDTIKGIVIGAVNGILAAINGLLGLVEGAVNNIINGINSVTGAVGIPAIPNLTIPKIPTIPMLAEGGTFLQPMLAVVGDAPETIVPHGNTPRSRALLREAALGVGGGLGRQAVTIKFSPVVYAGGDGQAKRGILEAEIEFERRMEAYFAKQRRVAF